MKSTTVATEKTQSLRSAVLKTQRCSLHVPPHRASNESGCCSQVAKSLSQANPHGFKSHARTSVETFTWLNLRLTTVIQYNKMRNMLKINFNVRARPRWLEQRRGNNHAARDDRSWRSCHSDTAVLRSDGEWGVSSWGQLYRQLLVKTAGGEVVQVCPASAIRV